MTEIECKEFVKYLGIIIDNNLSWKYHIDNIASKISKAIGIIARLLHFVPCQTLSNIYQCLINPYLNYGINVWGQASKIHLNKILVLQKRAMRLVKFKGNREHVIPLFISKGGGTGGARGAIAPPIFLMGGLSPRNIFTPKVEKTR